MVYRALYLGKYRMMSYYGVIIEARIVTYKVEWSLYVHWIHQHKVVWILVERESDEVLAWKDIQ